MAKSGKPICILDTEFNALDYAEQNDGYQEITEIGAVLMVRGKIVKRFHEVCRLYPGHNLAKRCKKITGMDEKHIREGIPFLDAITKFQQFANEARVYAYGADDALQLRATAKLNSAPKDVFDFIRRIQNIYPTFAQRLGFSYQCSLSDVCRICHVNHDAPGRAHTALCDAEDTAMAYHNLFAGQVDEDALAKLKEHKKNVDAYLRVRSVSKIQIKPLPCVDEAFFGTLEKVFQNAASAIREPVLTAIYDDLMQIAGRPDLEKGCGDL